MLPLTHLAATMRCILAIVPRSVSMTCVAGLCVNVTHGCSWWFCVHRTIYAPTTHLARAQLVQLWLHNLMRFVKERRGDCYCHCRSGKEYSGRVEERLRWWWRGFRF